MFLKIYLKKNSVCVIILYETFFSLFKYFFINHFSFHFKMNQNKLRYVTSKQIENLYHTNNYEKISPLFLIQIRISNQTINMYFFLNKSLYMKYNVFILVVCLISFIILLHSPLSIDETPL